MIEFKNVSFSYQKDEQIIDNLSFHVPENSIYGFLGANGSGKTTAIRLLLNLYKPSNGEVLIKNKKIKSSPIEFYKNVGTLIESPTFYGHLSGKQNLAIWANFYEVGNKRIDEVLDLVGLLNVKDKKAKKYSLGMKQRLGIATSILHNPEILVLDEPLNGLDPKGIAEIRNLFFKFQKEDSKTLFISSHLLNEIENTSSNLCIIDKGKKLFSGKIEELKSQLSEGYSYKLKCNNTDLAKTILHKEFNLSDITIEDSNNLFVDVNTDEIIPKCITALVMNDVQLFEVQKTEKNLEDLYLTLTKQ
ncbi:MAG: ABC transporter ATP-binding protein [Crocinitomicaceae bacterium]